jgi:hypothetical protein
MKELKIETILEKTEIGERSAMLAKIETGGFAVLARLVDKEPKVCFQGNFGIALYIYYRCAREVCGGDGMCAYN